MAAANIKELTTFAGLLADAAGTVLRRHFRSTVAVEDKADNSPVTIADRETEQTLRDAILKRYPQHGVRGEELGRINSDAEYVWVLDPIDGTRSFITGKPLFTTLIGLLHQGEAVLGVIDQPITRERWVGASGQPTTFNGAPCRVRPQAVLADATLFTTGAVSATRPTWCTPEERVALGRLIDAVKLTQYSTDGYAFGLLASGFIDLVVEAGMEPHDFCAAIPIVRGAGGVMGDWAGKPLDCGRKGPVLAAATPELVTAVAGVLGR